MFVETDAGGAFSFKNIRTGPYLLEIINTPGYQGVRYDPKHKGDESPQFSLKENEQRSDIVLKMKNACRISGKVVDESGKMPEDANNLVVRAGSKQTATRDTRASMGRLSGRIAPTRSTA